jgi:hypothetical protein
MSIFLKFWLQMFLVRGPILERQILERPFLERPMLERPMLERPILDATNPRRDQS